MNEMFYGGVDCRDIFVNDHVDDLGKLLYLGIFTVDALHHYWTPLMTAAYRKSLKCLILLIKKGSNINYLDHTGRNALHLAVCINFKEGVLHLLHAGSVVDVMGGEYTPQRIRLTPLAVRLYYGVCKDGDLIVEELLFTGADLNKVPSYIFIPPWVITLRDKIDQHRSTTLSLYGGYLQGKNQKKVVPPKDIILIICKMMWNKRRV